MTAADLAPRLARAVARHLGPPGDVTGLTRLTAGATKTTWAFDAAVGAETLPLILQQAGPRAAAPDDPVARLPRVFGAEDAALLRVAAEAGVPVPRVRLVLEPADGLGTGYVTDRIPGETLGRRIVRDPALAPARARFAARCGEALARLHAVDPARVPFLAPLPTGREVALYREIYESLGHALPALDWGLRWAAERAPRDGRLVPVHGDFRNGNLIVGPEGVRAVLDWELAHLGDPLKDLGWVSIRTWRFGGAAPVGGVGRREDLVAAYERAGGGPVDPERLRFWEAFGCVKWSVMCLMKGHAYLRGGERTVEALAIGRRAEEPLWDLFTLLDETGAAARPAARRS